MGFLPPLRCTGLGLGPALQLVQAPPPSVIGQGWTNENHPGTWADGWASQPVEHRTAGAILQLVGESFLRIKSQGGEQS